MTAIRESILTRASLLELRRALKVARKLNDPINAQAFRAEINRRLAGQP